MEESDAALVARAQQGDEGAFEQLVRQHQRYVFNVAYRVLNDYAEAEDVTQEAFVRAWRGLPGFRGQAQFTTWLYRIVHNLCLNRLPRLQRELLQTAPLEEVLANPAPSLPDVFEAREQMAFLYAELARMPEKYRLVLTLRYLQHLSYGEIAATLDLPMGTVKTHLHRARQLLMERLCRWEEQITTGKNKGENDINVHLKTNPVSKKREIELCAAST
ncbi:MAG: RNA polymerase sigma factor [Chloroflexota bacterium]|nr:RNA polymerase sigma factor [Chloroflexota bacterium]